MAAVTEVVNFKQGQLFNFFYLA